MSFIDGDDAISGDCFGIQEANALKNHWRASAAPADIVPGMIFSDDDDDKLYHAMGTSGTPLEEILQETLSSDKTPVFHAVKLNLFAANTTAPPTDAELDALFASTPAGKGAGFLATVKDTGDKMYLVGSDGTNWWTLTMVMAI